MESNKFSQKLTAQRSKDLWSLFEIFQGFKLVYGSWTKNWNEILTIKSENSKSEVKCNVNPKSESRGLKLKPNWNYKSKSVFKIQNPEFDIGKEKIKLNSNSKLESCSKSSLPNGIRNWKHKN